MLLFLRRWGRADSSGAGGCCWSGDTSGGWAGGRPGGRGGRPGGRGGWDGRHPYRSLAASRSLVVNKGREHGLAGGGAPVGPDQQLRRHARHVDSRLELRQVQGGAPALLSCQEEVLHRLCVPLCVTNQGYRPGAASKPPTTAAWTPASNDSCAWRRSSRSTKKALKKVGGTGTQIPQLPPTGPFSPMILERELPFMFVYHKMAREPHRVCRGSVKSGMHSKEGLQIMSWTDGHVALTCLAEALSATWLYGICRVITFRGVEFLRVPGGEPNVWRVRAYRMLGADEVIRSAVFVKQLEPHSTLVIDPSDFALSAPTFKFPSGCPAVPFAHASYAPDVVCELLLATPLFSLARGSKAAPKAAGCPREAATTWVPV